MNAKRNGKMNIEKLTEYAEQLAREKLGEDFDSLIPLGIETPLHFPNYNRLEFKVFLKNKTELFLNIFLKSGEIIGYDFVTKE